MVWRLATAVALLFAAGCAVHDPELAARVDRGRLAAQVELGEVPFFPQEQYQCGPAALATVLTYSGRPVTADSLAPRMYLPERRGSLQVELIATARSQGRIPYVLAPKTDALLAELNAGRPVVVLQNLGLEGAPIWHYAVVVGYSASDNTFLLRSGTERRRVESASAFGTRWALGQQWALIVLRPGELPASRDESRYLKSVADVEAVQGAAGLVPAYSAALTAWPDSRVARFGLARALDADGEPAAAEREYRKLLARNPDDVTSLNNLADLLRRSGCRTEALAMIGRALAMTASDDPLRPTLEQTQREIMAAPASDAACPR
ncbi:MAG TPA: PA2778 family cysteine peptidase [Burkholderiaceae bacterium]|jgi:hypothetical protein|nr:PA2778 family cysteine peptidase [Burkholderiaceae bacterium]